MIFKMDQKIKVVALDIYGTVLATDDYENVAKPRGGLKDFFDLCDSKNVKIASTSDAHIDSVMGHLESCFFRHNEERMKIECFDKFFRLNQLPKDYSFVYGHYDILPEELLVIDDKLENINSASKHGCRIIHVPEYILGTRAKFDFSKIRF